MSFLPPETVQISRILHAGFVLKAENVQIAFDPIFENPFSVNCHAFPAVHFDVDVLRTWRFDAVFLSHYHDDHCSLESLHLLDRSTPLYLFCVHDELFQILHDLGFEQVYPLTLNASVTVGPVVITPRRALNAEVDSIFDIRACGLRILNMVDSWMDSHTLSQLTNTGSWDLVLWPFQIMREVEVLTPTRGEREVTPFPEDWKAQLEALAPRFLVPSSCQFIHEEWSWYRRAFFPISYKRFSDWVQAFLPQTSIVKMNPGSSFLLNRKSFLPTSSLPGVHPIGDQNVDYDYSKEPFYQPIQEITQKFPALTGVQKKRVFEFCQKEILEKYFKKGPPTDPYFQKTRIWKLSVFDAQEPPHVFYYKLRDEQMSVSDKQVPHWTTEICGHKLFNALEMGETLTSLYLQINTEVFSPQIEDDLQFVDPLEDPLIRTVFYESCFNYQKAQLKRLNRK